MAKAKVKEEAFEYEIIKEEEISESKPVQANVPKKYILITHEGEGKSLNIYFEGNWKAKEVLFVHHQVAKAFKRYQIKNRRALDLLKAKEESNE